ncbi:hypothetical protein BTI91_04490 [Lactobacillus delbrueckii subsp. bulgaricus]|nr:hypothetical protein [Lactobacillus delbrueckii subsp. bulgaricus]
MLSFSDHVDALIKASDEFEAQIYDWAKKGSSNPQGAIDKIRRVLSDEFPDGYAATRDDVVKVALIRKEMDDVIRKIKKEALRQKWPTNSEDTSGS